MTNRKSKVRDGIQKSIRNMTSRLRNKQRRNERRLLSETLESRQLLAGPELVGIQSDIPTDDGNLFRDFETLVTNTLPTAVPELGSSPRELIFRFDGDAAISEESLAGITITRAGSDGFFEAANATDDLGTNGTVLVEYRAQSSGISGNGITINYKQTNRGNSGVPVIATADTSGISPVITLDLNIATGRTATVAEVIAAVNDTDSVNQIIMAQQVTGAPLTKVGQIVDTTSPVVLMGANSAQAITDLGTTGAVRVRLTATQSGQNGTGTTIEVKQRSFGGEALPLVLVSGKAIEVQVNSTAGFVTTVDQFLTALNANPEAASLVTGTLEVGAGSTLMGNRSTFYSPLVLTGASDSVIEPGYVGFGDSNREIVFRFGEALPDDTYRVDINAAGALGLRNEDGEYFNDGQSVTGQFKVNGGPKVLAVVPQPVTRRADGTLNVSANVIDVHVDGGDVDPSTLTNRDFYRLIYTRDTVGTADDIQLAPTSATYNSVTKIVRLEFANALSRVPDPINPTSFLDGAARLRIGSSEPVSITPTSINVGSDAADNFATAFNLNGQWTLSSNPNSGIQSATLSGEIVNTSDYLLQLPGGSDVPGVRDLRPDDPSRLLRTIPLDVLRLGADSESGITEFQYDFVNNWNGDDPTRPGIDESRTYSNLITEQQKARVREVLSLFSEYLGVQFVETTGGLTSQASFSIAVGELYGADTRVNSAAAIFNADGTVDLAAPESVVVATRDRNLDGVDDLAVLDFQDFDQSTDDQLGGEFFRGAFLAVGQLLGYGYADHLPQPVTQSTASVLNPSSDNEPAFPSVADIVNGQFMYRPESNDIDVYQFSLNQTGTISIETLAERLPSSSLLNTALRLYQFDTVSGTYTEIAANDDYFSNDSLIDLELDAGTYAVGVSASGNTNYDPATPGSGFGGLSQGTYQLNLSFRAKGADRIEDLSGNSLDGDLDGEAGGLFNFWFVPSDPNTTLLVDKAAVAPDLNPATSNPYLNLDDAIAAAQPGDTIRVVGNGGTDGDVSTVADNFAYEIGSDNRGIALSDGDSLTVPKDVHLVIDAGAVFKMRRSRVGVGSTAPLVDTSNASLQILGTPTILDALGRPVLDQEGLEIPGSVIFTSYNDDLDPDQPDSAQAGDWGGVDFRGDIDFSDESRTNLEAQGIFLNHLQFADLRYGGGQVRVDGRNVVVSPIEMAVTRPTIINSSIRNSADAAMAASPDTFEESRFTEAAQLGNFTPDYARVGPHIRGNTVEDNTINGLFVRVATRTGDVLQPLTVNARFDDTDIVHVLKENLSIIGSAGGPVENIDAPSSLLIRVSDRSEAGDLLTGSVPAGSYQYRITFSDGSGRETTPSQTTAPFTLAADGALRLTGLPTVPAASSFTSRRLYRATVQPDGTPGEFLLVGSLNASATTFVDTALIGSDPLPTTTQNRSARLDPGLTLDPGTILKIEGARIDVTFGSHFYAEGTDQRAVVMTSLSDSRYGAGGSYITNGQDDQFSLEAGDWAGVYVGFGGAASFDHAVIAGGGGQSRIPGGFASFNVIEVNQGDLRLANSRLESNADGRGVINLNEPDRGGRSTNASGTIFVRAAQPVILNNDFIGGFGPMASLDINSFSFNELTDSGRSTGRIDSVSSVGNSGPLLQGNRIAADPNDPDTDDDFGLNGVEIRGGVVSTEVVLDDVDIVHIVRDSIEVPNQHIYGGLRLESDARGSLVVKFEGETAGIVAGGSLTTAQDQFQDIADRIGGSLQIVGHPDFPVVLTALSDDTIGAGFGIDGTAALDTNGDGILPITLADDGDPENGVPSTYVGSGSWNGITIREAADDRNVLATSENEPRNVGNSDTNPTPGQSQFLGELAPSTLGGDENRRLGFIIDGSVSKPGDIDVYSFIGEAGTLVWLDIDRADMGLDSVVELIDANGNTLVLSDDSMAESMGTKNRLTGTNGLFESDNARALNQLATDGTNLTATDHQDLYSTNPRDAGMRVILPGEAGQRNIYHVRVRSSSVASGANGSLVVSGQTQNQELSSLRRGLTSGGYQLQIRLQEVDEHAGTQIRYSDVRFAVNGVQVIGGPIHSPLAGDEYEIDAPNDTLGNAQIVGIYSNTQDVTATEFGPLSSDRLSKSIGGTMSGLTDVDWYQFEVNYQDLTRDSAALYLATAFDLDYADGLARADTALYVFNEAGELILIGSDSNIADDQPLGTAQASDLSRGSFGNGDPYIGSSELVQGTYFVAVSNQTQVPQPLDQFFNRDTTNPLLRLEPIDSVQRLAEHNFDNYFAGTATAPTIPLLFDNSSIIDYTLDDVLLYVNTAGSLRLVNPFTGVSYGTVGDFGDEIRDIAFRGNGELFAYSGFDDRVPADDAWTYNRISTADASLTQISVGAGISTFHDLVAETPPAIQILDVDSNDGIEVEAISIRQFAGRETGFFVGNRPVPRQGLSYISNILYAFDDQTGLAVGSTFDLSLANAGAGTEPREIGQIDTVAPVTAPSLQLGITAATEVNAAGINVPSLFDGDRFTVTNGTETTTFEFDQDYSLIIGQAATINVGDQVSIKLAGQTARVFEFVTDAATVSSGNIPVVFTANLGPEAIAALLADAIREAKFPISAEGTQMSMPTAELVTVTLGGAVSSLTLNGEPGVDAGNVRIPLYPTDTSAVVAARIEQAVQDASDSGDLPNVTATAAVGADPRSVRFTGEILNVSSGVGTLRTTNLVAGGIPTGGSVTGIEVVGTSLYAVTDTGGLFVVGGGFLDAVGQGNREVGTYVDTATDLIGLNFTGLRAGPGNVQNGELSQVLFGITADGTIHAFNTRGELQPVFAGGRTSINTGIAGALGLDFSTLDTNLWHVTSTRNDDLGHGLNEIHSSTRFGQDSGIGRITGGNSLAFNFENQYAISDNGANASVGDARQDGDAIVNTYNFPGGAKGVVESNSIDLSEFASSDLPTMYFNYFLNTDNVDDTDGERDSLRVYVIDQNGVEHLVASNTEARGGGSFDDEFDDPPLIGVYNDTVDVDVAQLFDNADGNWRQARVPLDAFAGQSDVSLRIEYTTAGTTQTGTPSMRTVSAESLVEDSQIVVNGEVFAIDFAPAVNTPSGKDLATLYSGDPNAVAVITIDGQDYVLDDGTRTTQPGQIAISLLASQPAGTTLGDLSATDVANLVADTVDMTRLVPSGTELAALYIDPDAVFVVDFAGNQYVLNDGTRLVGVDQISVDLTSSSIPLTNQTETDIAMALSVAAGVPLPQFNVINDFNFSDPSDDPLVDNLRNDLLYEATELPYSGGNSTINGSGRIGSVDALGNLSNLDDVDLVRANVKAGTTISVDVDLDTNPALSAAIRFFDAVGNPLFSTPNTALDVVEYTATVDGPVYIGISGQGNDQYDPRFEGTAGVGQIDSYTASVRFFIPLDVQTDGNLIEVPGSATITTSSAVMLPVSGQTQLSGIPISVSRTASAEEVAQATSQAIADRFTEGDTTMVPVSGSMIRTATLTINDFGPFVNANQRYGDLFGSSNLAGSLDNAHEGVYLDDFIIGFAERGELVTQSRAVAATEVFIADGTLDFTSPSQPSQPTVTGSYQLEIRDASEYVDSDASARYRTFNTNDRLSEGYSITVLPGPSITDGSSFSVAGFGADVTFEFDVFDELGVSDGLNSPNSQVAIRVSSSATAKEVGNAIINALMMPSVTQILDVAATGANGNLGFQQLQTDLIQMEGDSRINIYGEVIVTDNGGAFADTTYSGLRGDDNRENSDQGVIIIENSRFLFNADAGVDLNRAAEARTQGTDDTIVNPSSVTYPRNLVELNTNNLLPGVVVQSNVMAFNANAGVRITGLGGGGGTQSDPIAFDRILNNTIFGGNVTAPAESFPDIYNDILFEQGEISFADAVVSYTAGDDVTAGFDDPLQALGIPDAGGRGLEPVDGTTTTSLGVGGSLTLEFTDNFLTGSGDTRPDLIVFETGAIEGVLVEVSRDGVGFFNVGIIAGIDSTIDLDASGFDAQDRFRFVRLTDLGQGTATSGPVGADIDAVGAFGALSTIGADIYVSGSQGIVVQNGAGPTLLNNVIANTETAITIDDAGSQTVIGGTTFYRNQTDAINNQPDADGAYAQTLPSALELFINPVELVFTPRAGTPIIDSSIDSLEDRSSLFTVRNAIGLPPSPIISPRFDVNGQLRVDDPNVETPDGIGESVFKDRGAEDRADEVGPRAVLVSPRAPDIGLEGGQVVTARSDIFTSFDIQLIDGIANADPTPGVGIDDASVTGDALLVTRNGQMLIEGEDYQFGYDPSNNVIRLTPLAGIWEDNSVYVVRLLDSSDAVLRIETGSQYNDRDLTTVIGLDGSFTTLEADTGINIVVDPGLLAADIDGQAVTIFDGVNTATFEMTTDGAVGNDVIGVLIASTASMEQVAAALAAAIDSSGLSLTAASADNRVQLLGSSTLSTATPLTDGFTVTVTNIDILMSADLVGAADGQTTTVSDGNATLVFEFDTDAVQLTPGSIQVPVLVTDTAPELAIALNTAIAAQGLNLTSQAVDNRVEILADSPLASAAASTTDIRIISEVTGPAIGTSVGFGIRVPNDGSSLDPSVADGQTFVIQRGANLIRTFELNFSGGLIDPTAIAVTPIGAPTIASVTDALIRAIGGAGLGLEPLDAGDGRITLGGDTNYAMNLLDTGLLQIASAGQEATIPVVIPIDATREEVALIYTAAIQSIGLPDVTVSIVGDRMVIDGVSAAFGTGAVAQPIVRDDVGNLLQSNTDRGTTELVIFVGGGADYGDAPSPYQSLAADNGPNHSVVENLYLGRGVTLDTDANLPNADQNDDGVRVTGAIRPGFATELLVDINLPTDPADNIPVAAPGVFYLDAWFDWNNDGVFAANEVQRFGSVGSGRTVVGVGLGNSITINVPGSAVTGDTYARFRISEDPSLGSDGFAASGEVEDYEIFVSSNPYRNPINQYDVNNSGEVTPLDALQIINALDRAGVAAVQLDQLPLPTNLPEFPDTNGDGVMTALDALNVINELNTMRNEFEASGEQVATGYVPMGEGVFASGATATGDLLISEANSGNPIASESTPQVVPSQSSKISVFDSAATMSVDSIVDTIAEDTASANDSDDPVSTLDKIFASL
ncbi:Dockerin type I repeat protein [Planctomycetes bacterium CA13]|uniref:Dockerin type I repeat protein n=1 Tax=Novipirellula herctigrandis TaxID=2527986 RepID=A0A5C5Z7G6_9BACT|nr:Dockerin type I repeat protein [Planctomycetes bacterium CA13]